MFSFFPILFVAAGVSAASGSADAAIAWNNVESSSSIGTMSTSSSWTPWQQAASAPSTLVTVTCSKRENETTPVCSPTMASTFTPSPFVSTTCFKAENETTSVCSTVVVPSTTTMVRTVGALPPSSSTTTVPLPGAVQATGTIGQATSTTRVVGAASPLSTFTIQEQGSSQVSAGLYLGFQGGDGEAQFGTSKTQFYIDTSGYLHESTTGWAANVDPSNGGSYHYMSFNDMGTINQSPQYYQICTASIAAATSVLTLNCGGFNVTGAGCSSCQVIVANSPSGLPGGIAPFTLVAGAV